MGRGERPLQSTRASGAEAGELEALGQQNQSEGKDITQSSGGVSAVLSLLKSVKGCNLQKTPFESLFKFLFYLVCEL